MQLPSNHSHMYLYCSLSFLEAFFDHIGDFVCKLNDATVINLFLTELKWVIVTHCRLITDCHTVTTCHIVTNHHTTSPTYIRTNVCITTVTLSLTVTPSLTVTSSQSISHCLYRKPLNTAQSHIMYIHT